MKDSFCDSRCTSAGYCYCIEKGQIYTSADNLDAESSCHVKKRPRHVHLFPPWLYATFIQGVPVLKVHIFIFELKKKNGVKNYIRKIV